MRLLEMGSFFLFGCGLALGQCLPATGAHITAADLSVADARFRTLPQGEILGFAPEPGVKRTFASAELERLARRYSLPAGAFREICVEVPLRAFGADELMAAMRSELPADAELSIVESASGLHPVGKLAFPRAALEPVAQDGTQIWRGQVQYAQTRKSGLWAKVRVSHKVQAVVAARDLPANVAITADQLSVRTLTMPVSRDTPASSLEQVAGMLSRVAIRAGTPISTAVLQQPASVKRGDAVKVEVQSGATKLVFDAVAERQGRDGDFIELRNPSTGKVFRAKLTGSRAVIQL